MEIVCALSGLVDLERPQRGIADMVSAGFRGILLDAAMCCPAHELESSLMPKEARGKQSLRVSEHPDALCGLLKPLVEQCGRNGLSMPIARAPYLNRNTKRTDLNGLIMRLTKESIRACGRAGCRYLVVRPLFAGIGRGDEWEVNREYYLGLADAAAREQVVLLLENQCHDLNGHLVRGICADAGEAASWVDRLNEERGEERFGFCMDTGVCCLCGQDMREFAVTLGERIKAVVLRECDGHHETAMIPFTCVNRGQSGADWLGLVRGLRETGFDGSLILDFGTSAAAFPQFLRLQLMQLARNVAEFFGWQIGMKNVMKKYRRRVLFGAGNMCRNYMKCYGEEFPPLFTCDNNAARWGERFEGLEIRPPEALKELEPDCAIFICNIYYREIEQQLREMGIANPVEYFNDEYMPSFYFDRLEMSEPMNGRRY